jgi:hypothetical protein
MKRLSDYIVGDANAARGARKNPRRDREPAAEAEPVRVIRSLGLDGASIRCQRQSISRPGLSG